MFSNFTIVVLTLFFGIYELIDKPWRSLSNFLKFYRIFMLIVLILIASEGISSYFTEKRETESKSNMGYLKAPKSQLSDVSIVFGGFIENNETTYLDLKQNPGIDLNAGLAGDSLVINTIIRDANGKTIFTINDNFWKLYQPSTYEVNNDENSVEVVDQKNRLIFHAKLEENTVYCEGVFCDINGYSTLIKSDSNYSDKNHLHTTRYKYHDFDSIDLVKKLWFKYPRELFYQIKNTQ